jgi:hypothetical protein
MRIFTRCKRLSTISRESFAKRSNVCFRASSAASRAHARRMGIARHDERLAAQYACAIAIFFVGFAGC